MLKMLNVCLLAMLAAVSCFVSRAAADEPVDALMLRYPDVSATQIVFCYANDLWLAPREGGQAVPLSSTPGREFNPRFNADGKTIAFSANYDGSVDIYTLPVSGGVPQRHTFEPGSESMQEWTPDGRIVYAAASARQPNFGAGLFYANHGGIPTPLPLVFADSASFSADGKTVAFTPWNAENRTWNRYQGGLASDIWTYNLDNKSARQITNFPGTDACPMYIGERIYYISDAGPEHRRNIWFADPATGAQTQVTTFDKFEVKYPNAGPDAIVLENGGQLYLLSVPGHELTPLTIDLPGDRKALRPQMIDAGNVLRAISPSPNMKRVAVEARGDIWSVPAEKGFAQNLTATDGTAERDPDWSPDGKWVTYFSDATGEYELYVRLADGSGGPRQLTKNSKQFFMHTIWSPDSKKIAYCSKAGELFICDVAAAESTKVDTDPWSSAPGVNWSPDSNWLTWSASDDKTGHDYIRLYNVKNRSLHDVTSPMFSSRNPVFDKNGDYLYFITARNYNLQFSDFDQGTTFMYVDSLYPAAIPLRKDLKSPWTPENDEEEVKADPAEAKDEKPGEKPAEDEKAADSSDESGEKKDEAKTDVAKAEGDVPEVKIDLDNMESRAIAVPVQRGGYGPLGAGKGMLFYTRENNDSWDLFRYDFKEKKEELVLPAVGGFIMSADSSKALANSNGQWFVIDARPGAKADKQVNTSGLMTEIDPRSEWRQLINDTYRIYRDYFYDPNMHGVDWAGVRDRSLKMVDHAAVREDVTYIISEMVAELNSGHTYVFGGNSENASNANTGTLGCDFEVASDAAGNKGVLIKHIATGAPWDIDQRGPLCQPGCLVNEGEFLIAVNNIAVNAERSPYELLQGKAGATVKLTVGPSATRDGKERDVLVQPAGYDGELRLRSWIETNRKWVDEQSGGRVGYIYVRSTGGPGLEDLVRQFNGQFMKDALIIDERWNGGGMIPDRFIELLDRPIRSYWAKRDGNSWRTPQYAHAGPKVMLINGHAGSGGDGGIL